jgi:hypothetical protein
MLTPSNAKPATNIPVMAPDLNASSRPPPNDEIAACAVRAFARTDTFMPMKPAAPERIAPMAKPMPTSQPRKKPTIRKITMPTRPMVVYWRLR